MNLQEAWMIFLVSFTILIISSFFVTIMEIVLEKKTSLIKGNRFVDTSHIKIPTGSGNSNSILAGYFIFNTSI